jgi:hypothetical protein
VDKPHLSSPNFPLQDRYEKVILFFILLIAATFRFVAAFQLSLSNDELSALTRARHDTFLEMITHGVLIDFHPAGIQSLIYFWIKFVGDDPFIFRLPFVLAGILSTYLIFEIGKRWFSSFTALFAASVFAVFQFSILYSFFARPYSPGLLFGLLATLAWSRIFFSKDEDSFISLLKWWILFVLAMIGCTHTHYFSLVYAASLGIAGLFFLKPGILRPYILSGLVIILAFIPEWEIFKVQISTGDIGGWLAAPGRFYLFDFTVHMLNDSTVFAWIFLGATILGSVMMLMQRTWTKFHTLSICLFLFSFLIAYLYSVFRHPVIQFSTLYFTLPFVLFIAGQAFEKLIGKKKVIRFFIPILVLAGSFHTVFSKGIFYRAQYGVFLDLAEDIDEWQSEFGKENVPVILNVINPEYMNYYFRELDIDPYIHKWKLESRQELLQFGKELDSLKTDYVCFAWSNSANPYEIIRMLRERFPVILKRKVYFNSASYLFARTGSSLCQEPFIHMQYNFDLQEWQNNFSESEANEGTFLLDSLHEFSPSFQIPIKTLQTSDFQIVSAKIDFLSVESESMATVVISYDSSGIPQKYYSLALDECDPVPGNWQTVYFSRVITKDIDRDWNVNIYIYNGSHKNIYLRNFIVTIEDWDDPYTSGID